MDKVLQSILDASCPEDVFGAMAGTAGQKHLALKTTFRHLAQVVHPDHHADKTRATEAFARLTALHVEAEAKIAAGTYGDKKKIEAKPSPSPVVVQVKKRKYVVGALRCSGDVADLYDCTWTDGPQDHPSVFKIARNAGDNDLMDNEAKAVKHVFKETKPEAEKLLKLLPHFVDNFGMRDATHHVRRVNVFDRYDEYVPLDRIMRAFPHGIDYKDAAWMLKRILSALSVTHAAGVVHGAVIPPHVLIHPVNHGAMLIDWTGAVVGAGKVPFVSKEWRSWYAPEILRKAGVTPATDIFTAAKSMVTLLGGDPVTMSMPDVVPRRLQAFLRGCALDAPHARPNDAWELHKEFDELMYQLVGKRKYRPFAMPQPS